MRSAQEISKEGNRHPFPLRVPGTRKLPHKTQVRSAHSAPSVVPYELDLSGSQLLLGSILLFAAGLVLWSCLRLWLFAQ
jgi:hypothetical protein